MVEEPSAIDHKKKVEDSLFESIDDFVEIAPVEHENKRKRKRNNKGKKNKNAAQTQKPVHTPQSKTNANEYMSSLMGPVEEKPKDVAKPKVESSKPPMFMNSSKKTKSSQDSPNSQEAKAFNRTGSIVKDMMENGTIPKKQKSIPNEKKKAPEPSLTHQSKSTPLYDTPTGDFDVWEDEAEKSQV